MRTRYINLDRAPERRRLMDRQATASGLDFERFPAVEAAGISDTESEEIGRSWERPLTKPELACFLSHRTLWEEVASSAAPMVILEDDVILTDRLRHVYAPLEGLTDVDFLNLESCDRRRFVSTTSRQIDETLSIRRTFRDKSGSGAYVLWPAGARKLLRRAERGAAPVDAFLHGLRSLRSFQIEPAVAMQLHIMEARGLDVPISSATFIQAPRRKLPLTIATVPFHARRLSTQLRLAGDHLSRLSGRVAYRRTEVVEADFVRAVERTAAAGSSDHSFS